MAEDGSNEGQKLGENYEKEFKPINCIQNVSAYLLCKNDECTKFPFLCSNQECKCHQQHPKCMKSTKKSVTIALEDKLFSYKNFENKVKEQIKKNIAQFQTQLLAQCQKKFNDLFGLSEFEDDFMKAIKHGKVENITSKTIWNVILNLKKSHKVTKMMVTFNQIWEKFSKDLYQLHFDTKDRLELFGCQLFEDSKLLLTQKEQQITRGFFKSQGQEIKSAKLLFRASQNDFSAVRFHDACNGHGQTITVLEYWHYQFDECLCKNNTCFQQGFAKYFSPQKIHFFCIGISPHSEQIVQIPNGYCPTFQHFMFCQSAYGKKFGGYTPLAWKSNDTYYTDSTYKSFTFSITNNHKLVSDASSTNHQYCSSQAGPVFGDGPEILVADKCNQNFDSHSNVNYRYKNNNYKNGYPESWKLFTGAQQNYKFKVKEYEVWKIEFA